MRNRFHAWLRRTEEQIQSKTREKVNHGKSVWVNEHLESLQKGWLFSRSVVSLCDIMDCSPPGSSVRGIVQARILEQVAISFSRDLPDPGTEPVSLRSPALAGGFFTAEPPGKRHG